MKNPCPKFEEAPKEILEEDYTIDGELFPPYCSGNWIAGSGGHRVHSPRPCHLKATWWHPDDMFAYCDKHVPEVDIPQYKKLWEKTLK